MEEIDRQAIMLHVRQHLHILKSSPLHQGPEIIPHFSLQNLCYKKYTRKLINTEDKNISKRKMIHIYIMRMFIMLFPQKIIPTKQKHTKTFEKLFKNLNLCIHLFTQKHFSSDQKFFLLFIGIFFHSVASS